MSERRPKLLAVYDKLVAIQGCAGAESCEIGTGAGFRESLAPDLFAGQDLLNKPFLLFLGPVLQNSWPAHRQAQFVERRRRSHSRRLFVKNSAFDDRSALAAVFGGP